MPGRGAAQLVDPPVQFGVLGFDPHRYAPQARLERDGSECASPRPCSSSVVAPVSWVRPPASSVAPLPSLPLRPGSSLFAVELGGPWASSMLAFQLVLPVGEFFGGRVSSSCELSISECDDGVPSLVSWTRRAQRRQFRRQAGVAGGVRLAVTRAADRGGSLADRFQGGGVVGVGFARPSCLRVAAGDFELIGRGLRFACRWGTVSSESCLSDFSSFLGGAGH